MQQELAEQNKKPESKLNITTSPIIRLNPKLRKPITIASPIKENDNRLSQSSKINAMPRRSFNMPISRTMRGGTKKNISLTKSHLKKIQKAVDRAILNNNNAIQQKKKDMDYIEQISIKIPSKKTLRKTLRKKLISKHNKTLRKIKPFVK